MESIIGGVLIGISVSLMLLLNGRVTGISGIIANSLKGSTKDKGWRIMFILGLVLGGLTLKVLNPSTFEIVSHAKVYDYIVAGFLVGFGTVMGGGCTSGHGVCGMSRFSIRSILATLTFITAGVISVLIFKLTRGEL